MRFIMNLGIFIVCLGLPIAGWIFFNDKIPSWFPDTADRGIYGDQFGALILWFSRWRRRLYTIFDLSVPTAATPRT